MFVEWDEKYSIGIPLIDNQHKALIVITNRLYEACQSGTDSAGVQFKKAIKEAVAYVKFHLSVEEQIQEKTGYPEYAAHKELHAAFVKEILSNVESYQKGKKFIPNQFVRFLRDWILSHIALVDTKLGAYLVDLQKSGKLGEITMKKKNGAEA